MSRYTFSGPVVINSRRGDYEIVTREFRNALLSCLRNHTRTSLRQHVQWMLNQCETKFSLERILTALQHSSHKFDLSLVLDVQIEWPEKSAILVDHDSKWNLLLTLCLCQHEIDAANIPKALRQFGLNSPAASSNLPEAKVAAMNRTKPEHFEVDDEDSNVEDFELARQALSSLHHESIRFDGDFEPYRLH